MAVASNTFTLRGRLNVTTALRGTVAPTVALRGRLNVTTALRGVWEFVLTSGMWASSVAPTYTVATRAQRKASGYWTDAAGLADSTDVASTGSTWSS